ncbi:MAG: hypothetical protein DCC58_09005 [Chloroflexi bacterium]|nr:MAG: hypothetical protein DCC58_09005 [Chloroflexota bacterium]
MYTPPALLGTIALIVGLALLGLEALTAMNLPDPLPPPKPHPEYGWMRANPAPTLELPMGEGPVASAWPNYWSMLHWNQVVNGYSGLLPPSYFPLRERMRAFPDAATVRLLQGIGVTTVVVHEEMPPGERARLEAAAATFPQLTLALPGPDAVYTLVADPWMWRLAGAVPPGADVDLPAANADPLAFGLLLAILQREGHTVYGSGQLDYYAFQPAPSPRCYTVLPSGIDPTSFGYPGATVVLHEPEMTLYRRAGCE